MRDRPSAEGLAGVLISPTDDRWARALVHTRHDVYDTPSYALIEADHAQADPIGFLVEDDDYIFLVPLLIRRVPLMGHIDDDVAWDAISPYGYPGIVLSESARSSQSFVSGCTKAMVGLLAERGICSAFIRLHPHLNADLPMLITSPGVTPNGLTVSIDLQQSVERIWATMRKGHTNAVNQAVRAGFTTSIVRHPEHFDDVTSVYGETLSRHSASASAYDYDESLLRRLAMLDEAHIAVAEIDGVVAGAYILFECNGIVQMHLGGSLSAYRRPSPSNLLIHAVALWAKQRGNAYLHLGGGIGGSSEDNLFMFKSGFSPVRHEFATLRLVADQVRYDKLVAARSDEVGVSSATLLASDFFPAYRAG